MKIKNVLDKQKIMNNNVIRKFISEFAKNLMIFFQLLPKKYSKNFIMR